MHRPGHAAQAAILILDDSTSAVDSATDAAIRESFARNLAGTTVIIIARASPPGAVCRRDHHSGRRPSLAAAPTRLLASNPIPIRIYRSQQEGWVVMPDNHAPKGGYQNRT